MPGSWRKKKGHETAWRLPEKIEIRKRRNPWKRMKHSHGYILTAPGLKKKRALGPQHSGFLFLRPRYPSQGQKTSHPNNLALTDKHQQYDRCHRKTKQNKTKKNNKKEGSGLPITRAASANQNVTNSIPCEKPEEWPPCLPHSLATVWKARAMRTKPSKSVIALVYWWREISVAIKRGEWLWFDYLLSFEYCVHTYVCVPTSEHGTAVMAVRSKLVRM